MTSSTGAPEPDPLQSLARIGGDATTSMGIFMATLAPTMHFTELSQAILYRGAGLGVVWMLFVALLLIDTALFSLSLARFRKTISKMA